MNNISKCLVAKSTNMSNFHPLEGVCRGSETKLQERNDIINNKKTQCDRSFDIFKLSHLNPKKTSSSDTDSLTRHTKENSLKKSW